MNPEYFRTWINVCTNVMFQDMILTAGENKGGLLEPGIHQVRIAQLIESVPKHNGSIFRDQDPQLGVVFRNAEGQQHTNYYNMHAYKKYADLSTAEKQSGKFTDENGWALEVKTGLRVKVAPSTPEMKASVDYVPNRTDQARSIVEGLATATGIPLGSTFKLSSLIGRELTIILGTEANPVTGNLDTRLKAIKPVTA